MLNATELCRCLADDTRLALVSLLAGNDEACVCELVDRLAAPQSTISRHLGLLRQCGIVTARRDGTWMHYRINPDLPTWARASIDLLAEPAREQLGLEPVRKAC